MTCATSAMPAFSDRAVPLLQVITFLVVATVIFFVVVLPMQAALAKYYVRSLPYKLFNRQILAPASLLNYLSCCHMLTQNSRCGANMLSGSPQMSANCRTWVP